MTTETDYECDICKKELSWEEVAYLGGGDGCSPFAHLDCYCKECYEKIENKRREQVSG